MVEERISFLSALLTNLKSLLPAGHLDPSLTVSERIVAFMEACSGEPLMPRDIAKAIGVSSQQVSNCLSALKEEGKVERTEDGWITSGPSSPLPF